jgi:DNA-binding GntR family transcriptional regulator
MSASIRDDRPQLSDEAASYVREMIISGQLRPGEFIRLDRLASDLAMSVTPVRQALVTLRGEGFVQLEPRRGFQVAELCEDDILDLFSVQAFVAGELAAHAAISISEQQIARLKAIVADLESAMQRGADETAEALAHEFHEVVIESANRPKLAWLLQVSGRYEPRRFYSDISGWHRLSSREHKTILVALKKRDAEGARASMSSHVRHLGQLVASNFSAVGQSPVAAAARDEPQRPTRRSPATY